MEVRVSKDEVHLVVSRQPLVHSVPRLTLHYGPSEADKMVPAVKAAGRTDLLPCLQVPGVGTRWQSFVTWLKSSPSVPEGDCERALFLYANFLGRVISYRALSLTDEQFNVITTNNTIWPTGRLRASDEAISRIVEKHGTHKVAYARLYIGMGLLPLDPSLSLHDDAETAVCIGSGYLAPNKSIHVMQLDVPLIETLGYRVGDLHRPGTPRWFDFSDVWFDSALERTERYVLYEIPFFSQRLRSLVKIPTLSAAKEFIAPFKRAQLLAKEAYDKSHPKESSS
ncbi:hypothetical protein Pelo_2478 [Pelomyxa schiedti]|nr:hypothetical protein Pelo_2478 [Pelomyxa schiedti]